MMTREIYSYYKFEILHELIPVWSSEGKTEKKVDGFIYKIYGSGCPFCDDGIIDSDEWFESEQEARYAAIGHITLLENGEA